MFRDVHFFFITKKSFKYFRILNSLIDLLIENIGLIQSMGQKIRIKGISNGRENEFDQLLFDNKAENR